MTRSELLDRLAVLLGGRVAEELAFEEISTGAQNDLQRATDIARSIVTEYGMSDRLGLVTYERPRQAMFLPESFSPNKTYSEEKAGLEKRRLYETRHTFATLMLDAGELPGWIQKMMGHETLQMIHDRYYSQVLPEEGRECVHGEGLPTSMRRERRTFR